MGGLRASHKLLPKVSMKSKLVHLQMTCTNIKILNVKVWPQPQTALFTCTIVSHFGQVFPNAETSHTSLSTPTSSRSDQKSQDAAHCSKKQSKFPEHRTNRNIDHAVRSRVRITTQMIDLTNRDARVSVRVTCVHALASTRIRTH